MVQREAVFYMKMLEGLREQVQPVLGLNYVMFWPEDVGVMH